MIPADVNGPAGLTDDDLAQAIAGRPAGAAAREESELQRRFGARVHLYGLRHLRDEDSARDLVRQVMLLTMQQLRRGAVRKSEGIGAFILAATLTAARELSRAERRRFRRPESGAGRRAAPPTDFAIPCDLDRLESCLRQLEERDRAVLMLTFYAEKAAGDVGQELGLSAGHVRVVRQHALERLRHCVTSGKVPR
jgi:RNA polymerase sigma-70 factor (ECF subfamily)